TAFPEPGAAPSVDLRPQLHFHPAGLAAVELLVGLDGVADRLVLGEELARIDRARPDELDQLRQVRPVVAVAHPHDQVLVHRQADGERLRLEAMQSMAKMRPAPRCLRAAMASCPTGPQPKTATVLPGLMPVSSAPKYEVGKMSERRIACSSATSSGSL